MSNISKIIRGKRPQHNFYILDKRISEDARLTWEARGVLIFLLGKPDDWKVSVAHLIKVGSAKRDKMYRIINELIEIGYCTRQKGPKGHGCDYVISEFPLTEKAEVESPLTEKPLPEKPVPSKTTLVSTDIKQELNMNKTTCEVRVIFDYWQKQINKPKAMYTESKKKFIRARIKEGFTTDQLKNAIDGCAGSAWHMGLHPDNATEYNGIENVFRNAEKTEGLIKRFDQAQAGGAHVTNHQNSTCSTSKKFGPADVFKQGESMRERAGDGVCPTGLRDVDAVVLDGVYQSIPDDSGLRGDEASLGQGNLSGSPYTGADGAHIEQPYPPEGQTGQRESVPAEFSGVPGLVSVQEPLGNHEPA